MRNWLATPLGACRYWVGRAFDRLVRGPAPTWVPDKMGEVEGIRFTVPAIDPGDVVVVVVNGRKYRYDQATGTTTLVEPEEPW